MLQIFIILQSAVFIDWFFVPHINCDNVTAQYQCVWSYILVIMSESDCESADSRTSKRLRSAGGSHTETGKTKRISLNTIYDLLINTKTELSEKIDAAIGDLSNKLATVTKTCNDRYSCVNENLNSINKRLDRMENTLDFYERSYKSCEVLVRGIPMVANETFDLLKDYFVKMCDATGTQIQSTDIVAAYRLLPAGKRILNGASTTSSFLLVYRLASKQCKEKFMASYFQRKTLCLKDIGFETSSRIFCNDHLSSRSHAIFRAALKLKLENVVNSVFTLKGFVFVRKTGNNGERAVKITDLSELSTLQPAKL